MDISNAIKRIDAMISLSKKGTMIPDILRRSSADDNDAESRLSALLQHGEYPDWFWVDVHIGVIGVYIKEFGIMFGKKLVLVELGADSVTFSDGQADEIISFDEALHRVRGK